MFCLSAALNFQALVDNFEHETETKTVAAARAYCATFLYFHISSAVETPLSTDVGYQSWLLHSNVVGGDVIQHQAFMAAQPFDIEGLADWFNETKRDYFHAARIWVLLRTLHPTGTSQTRATWGRRARDALKKIPAETKTCAELSLEEDVIGRLIMFGDKQAEKDALAEWMMLLTDDESRMEQLNDYSKMDTTLLSAVIRIGHCNTGFCVNPTLSQLQRGAASCMESGIACVKASRIRKDPYQSMWIFAMGMAYFSCISIGHIASNFNEAAHEALGIGGSAIMEWEKKYGVFFQ